jgi:hypothetical protein
MGATDCTERGYKDQSTKEDRNPPLERQDPSLAAIAPSRTPTADYKAIHRNTKDAKHCKRVRLE